MVNIIKGNGFIFLLLLTFSVFIYYNLQNTFYQQDEWQTLGHNFVYGFDHFKKVNPLFLIFGEYRPLSTLLYLALLGFFKFTVVPSAIFSIVVHAFNSFLTYQVAEKVTKSKIISLVAALFLITNSISHQAITWVSAVGTLPATTFVLLSILSFFKYLSANNRKFLYASFIFTIVSLLFKGIGFFLFILFPLVYLLDKNKSLNVKNIKEIIKVHFLFFSFGAGMLFFRFLEFFLRNEKGVGQIQANDNFIQIVFFRFIFYPVTSLFQIFVPPSFLYDITTPLTKMQYKFLVSSPISDLIAQSIVADMISFIGAVIILFVIFLIYSKTKLKEDKKGIVFGLLFFMFSFLPYVVIDRDSSYLSSRYFYVGGAGAGILLGYIVSFLMKYKYSKWTVLILIAFFFYYHAGIIKKDISYQVQVGNERKALLAGIKKYQPTLSNNSIIYVTGDKQYFGPITNPFQNGLGYVLEVWYYDSGSIPREFLKDNFLWDLGSEGYRTYGNYGFGYFQSMDKMAEAVLINRISEQSIHAFYISSKNNRIINITQETRKKVLALNSTKK